MPLCQARTCGCAITSNGLVITGDGSPGSPWQIEGASPQRITEAQRLALSGGSLFEGLYVHTTDVHRLWSYYGSAWHLVSGRCNWTGVGTTVVPAASTVLLSTWTEIEDTDGFWTSGTDFVLPALVAGKYAVSLLGNSGVPTSAPSTVILNLNGALLAANHIPIGTGTATATRGSVSLSPGQIINAAIVNSHSAPVSFTCTLEINRTGP